jgi:hypothetical protein
MSRRSPRSDRARIGGLGWLGLLAGIAGLSYVVSAPSSAAQQPARGAAPPPTEQIPVDQAVDFPWDI